MCSRVTLEARPLLAQLRFEPIENLAQFGEQVVSPLFVDQIDFVVRPSGPGRGGAGRGSRPRAIPRASASCSSAMLRALSECPCRRSSRPFCRIAPL